MRAPLLLLFLSLASPLAAERAVPPHGGATDEVTASSGSGEASEPQSPPGAESPQSAGARFSLGIDLLSDRRGDLEELSGSTSLTLRDADGGTQRLDLPGDPELDNRKFDRHFDGRGFGLELPVALPRFHLAGSVTVFPSIVLELAVLDVDVDFVGRTEPGADRSLSGRGLMLGAGVSWVATLCRHCRWFWGGDYRYRTLPDLGLDGVPGFGAPGLEVLSSEDRLRLDSHRLTGRLGYRVRGGRYAPYLGLRYRTTDVRLEDELRLASPELGQETRIVTRSKLDDDAMEGVVGVDVRLARNLAARLETSIGDADRQALLKIVFTGFHREREPAGQPPVPPVIELTLKLFWDLAAFELRDPSEAARLPRAPAGSGGRVDEILARAGIDVAAYRERITALLGTGPEIRFEPLDAVVPTNPFAPSPPGPTGRSPAAPPMRLLGPLFQTVIRFSGEPAASAAHPAAPAPGVATAALWSRPLPAAGLHPVPRPVLARAEEAGATAENHCYDAQPQTWDPGVKSIEHRLCLDPDRLLEIHTVLVYAGGRVDHEVEKVLKQGQLAGVPEACARCGGNCAGRSCYRVSQPLRRHPGKPCIIAAGYLRRRRAKLSEVLAVPILVQ